MADRIFCKDCAFFEPPTRTQSQPVCMNPALLEARGRWDLIWGTFTPGQPSICYDERRPGDEEACGPDARYFKVRGNERV
jgi:hypothetical protein